MISNPISGVFTNSSAIDHSYTVTVCVSQPVRGTREPWSFTSGGPTGSSQREIPSTSGILSSYLARTAPETLLQEMSDSILWLSSIPIYPSDQGILDDNEKNTL